MQYGMCGLFPQASISALQSGITPDAIINCQDKSRMWGPAKVESILVLRDLDCRIVAADRRSHDPGNA
jgi:hypothetical protein